MPIIITQDNQDAMNQRILAIHNASGAVHSKALEMTKEAVYVENPFNQVSRMQHTLADLYYAIRSNDDQGKREASVTLAALATRFIAEKT